MLSKRSGHVSSVCCWIHRNLETRLILPLELDDAVNKRKDRVVLAKTDIVAGVDVGAVLADDDVAGYDLLATELLNTKTLGIRIPTVLGRPATFFVCHCCARLDIDVVDRDARVALTMSVQLLVTFATLLVEDQDLVALAMSNNRCLDRSLDVGSSNGHFTVIAGQKDVCEFNCFTHVVTHEWDDDRLLGGDGILLTGDFDDCVHDVLSSLIVS